MEEYVRQVNTNIELSQEIERLHSIIKEAREYIKNNSENFDGDLCIGDYFELKDIVEILERANNDK